MSLRWVTAAEASEALEISVQSLYAYVSRGLISSKPAGGKSRAKLYSWADIERLLRNRKHDPEESLSWGPGIIESSVSCIQAGRLYYRGRPIEELVGKVRLQQLAALLWRGEADLPLAKPTPIPSSRLEKGDFLNAALRSLARLLELEVSWDMREHALDRTGQNVVWTLARLIWSQPQRESLNKLFELHPRQEILQEVVTVCADHELNASTFTARCAASTGANLICSVIAGLAALSGPRHGASVLAVEALFREAQWMGAEPALKSRLRRGEAVPGFGHKLYPDGDPRAAILMKSVPTCSEAYELQSVGRDVLGESPSVDFALVALARAYQWPPEWPFALFALGRSFGWIAHIIEEYQRGRVVRPRARYPDLSLLEKSAKRRP